MKRVYVVEICGMSGDGTIAAGAVLNEALSRLGYRLLAFDTYPAEVRGTGRCLTRTAFGPEPVRTKGEGVDVLVSLDDRLAVDRAGALRAGGFLLRETPGEETGEPLLLPPGVLLYEAPFAETSREASGGTRARNLAALGALAGLLGFGDAAFLEAIDEQFRKAPHTVIEGDRQSFELGFERAGAMERKGHLPPPPPDGAAGRRQLLSGNEAASRAALDGELCLYAAYPITPATPILELLAAELPRRGGAVLQMEDEIAALGAVLGASYAGRRAMTATSGPGLCLMTELINLAVMAEVPAVIVDVQRGGPSTGLPTRTEQGDLNLAVFGGAGDSPRIVLAPADVAEVYRFLGDALRLAEKYQTPVVVLMDFFLANRVETVDPLALWRERPPPGEEPLPPPAGAPYLRYALTPSGISPRAVPGMRGLAHTATGIEHTEAGQPDYSSANHAAMTEKRWRKIQGAAADAPVARHFGEKGSAEVGLLAWGSSTGAVREAVERARGEGIRAAGMALPTLWPFPAAEVSAFLDRSAVALCPEVNRWGQLAALASGATGRPVRPLAVASAEPPGASPILEAIREAARAGRE